VREEAGARACKISFARIARLHRCRSRTTVTATKPTVTTATHSGGIPIAISIAPQAPKNKSIPKNANAIPIGDRGSFELLLTGLSTLTPNLTSGRAALELFFICSPSPEWHFSRLSLLDNARRSIFKLGAAPLSVALPKEEHRRYVEYGHRTPNSSVFSRDRGAPVVSQGSQGVSRTTAYNG
jgi:hypothetical protein